MKGSRSNGLGYLAIVFNVGFTYVQWLALNSDDTMKWVCYSSKSWFFPLFVCNKTRFLLMRREEYKENEDKRSSLQKQELTREKHQKSKAF